MFGVIRRQPRNPLQTAAVAREATLVTDQATPSADLGPTRRRLLAWRRVAGSRRVADRRGEWLGTLSVVAFLIAWQLASWTNVVPSDLLPGPIAVVAAFWHVAATGYRGTTLGEDAAATLGRCLAGFVCAVAVGVPLGLLMGTNRKVAAFFNYFVQFLRPLPPLSYMVLLILWFGTGNGSKVILLFLTALPIIISASMAGVRSVPRLRIQAALVLGANGRQIFRHVILPSALPMIFTGLKIALAAAFSTVVAAEFIAANDGLGWMVLSANKFLQNSTVMMGIVLLGILGMLLAKVLDLLDRRFIHWRRVG